MSDRVEVPGRQEDAGGCCLVSQGAHRLEEFTTNAAVTRLWSHTNPVNVHDGLRPSEGRLGPMKDFHQDEAKYTSVVLCHERRDVGILEQLLIELDGPTAFAGLNQSGLSSWCNC